MAVTINEADDQFVITLTVGGDTRTLLLDAISYDHHLREYLNRYLILRREWFREQGETTLIGNTTGNVPPLLRIAYTGADQYANLENRALAQRAMSEQQGEQSAVYIEMLAAGKLLNESLYEYTWRPFIDAEECPQEIGGALKKDWIIRKGAGESPELVAYVQGMELPV